MSDGWAVKVTRTLTTGGGTQTEIWYAAIPGRTEAENAVGEHVSVPSATSVSGGATRSRDRAQGHGPQ